MADKTPTVETPTVEELRETEKTFMNMWENSFLDRHKVRAEGEPEPEPVVPAEPAAPAEPAPAAPVAPAAPAEPTAELTGLTGTEPPAEPAPAAPAAPAAAAPAQPVIDPDDIADRVANRLQPKVTSPPTPDNPYAKFSEADQKQLRVLEHLNKTSDKYKGRNLVQEATEFYTREAAYKENWIRSNPGEKFDPQDDAHKDFYDKFEPVVDTGDLDEAKIDLIASARAEKIAGEAVRQQMAPIQEQAKKAERTAKETELRPKIDQKAFAAVKELVLEVVPEFKDLLSDGKMDDKALARMKEKDPEALMQVDREAILLRARVRELETMAAMPEHFQFNESLVVDTKAGRIRPHADIINAGMELEEEFMRKPQSETMRGGREFLPQYMLQNKLDLCRNEDQVKAVWAKYWIVGPDDIRAKFIKDSAENVKKVMDIANQRVARMAKGSAPAAGTTPPPNPAPNPTKPNPTPPPSTGSVSDNVDTRIPAAPATPNQHEVIASRMFA